MGKPIPTDTPAPVAAAAAAAFGALSRLRGARIFHPRGVGYSALVRVEEPQGRYPGVPMLERPGEHPALVRFSRAVGLPEPLPDALGLALRLVDLHGPGRHQDFLLVTSAHGPLLHHLLLPDIGRFPGQPFSSILPYRVGGSLRVVGATPDSGGRAFRLALAPLMGRFVPFAGLEVGERLPGDETEQLAFTPWNTGGGIRPAGPLNGVRLAAYRGSQHGRGLRDGHIP